VAAGFHAVAAGLEAVDLDGRIIQETVEKADGVGPATNTRADGVWQAARTGVSNDAGWLDVDNVQDDIVIENLRHAAVTLAAGGGRAVVHFISIAINSCEQKPRPT
jgi:hypothetical protein